MVDKYDVRVDADTTTVTEIIQLVDRGDVRHQDTHFSYHWLQNQGEAPSSLISPEEYVHVRC